LLLFAQSLNGMLAKVFAHFASNFAKRVEERKGKKIMAFLALALA
jgi:hypothetical protein